MNRSSRQIGAGLISACLFLLSCSGLIFVSPFLLLPILYVGFRDGLSSAHISLGITILVTGVVFGVAQAVVLLTFFGMPGIYIIYQILAKHQVSKKSQSADIYRTLIEHTMLVCLIIMLCVWLLMAVFVTSDIISEYYQALIHGPFGQKIVEVGLTETVFQQLGQIIPGLIAFNLFVSLIINSYLAMTFLNRQVKSLVVTTPLSTMKLQAWPWLCLTLWGGLTFIYPNPFIQKFGLNVLLVLGGLFMLQGISIIHTLQTHIIQNIGFLIGFYVLMILFFPWVASVLILFGVFEPWLNLRKKINVNFRS